MNKGFLKTVPVWVWVSVGIAAVAVFSIVAWHLAGGGMVGMH